MGQWGKTITVGGAAFVPHVSTAAWSELRGGCQVDEVILLDSGADREGAIRRLGSLKQRFVGKPYSEWLDETVTGETT